jgi:hypothetical protein
MQGDCMLLHTKSPLKLDSISWWLVFRSFARRKAKYDGLSHAFFYNVDICNGVSRCIEYMCRKRSRIIGQNYFLRSRHMQLSRFCAIWSCQRSINFQFPSNQKSKRNSCQKWDPIVSSKINSSKCCNVKRLYDYVSFVESISVFLSALPNILCAQKRGDTRVAFRQE